MVTTLTTTALSGKTIVASGLDVGEDVLTIYDEGFWTPVTLIGVTNVSTAWVAATATVTIAEGSDLLDSGAATVAITTTDGTVVTATAHASTTTTTDTNAPTFAYVVGNDTTTAANLASCLNANSKLTAVNASEVVTVTQSDAAHYQLGKGTGGNTTVTVVDAGDVGMTKTNFTGGVDGCEGFFTRVGDRVAINATLRFNRGTSTGSFTVTGLPFNGALTNEAPLAFLLGDYIDATPPLSASVGAGAAIVSFYKQPNSTSDTRAAMADGQIKASTAVQIDLAGVYHA